MRNYFRAFFEIQRGGYHFGPSGTLTGWLQSGSIAIMCAPAYEN